MIYVDASVALAHLLGEDRAPPKRLWEDRLVASRLLEYESWTRVHALGLASSHGAKLQALLERIALVEMVPPVLRRALAPFPIPVPTLDALHLATVEFLRERRLDVSLASYDKRLATAAGALGVPLTDLA